MQFKYYAFGLSIQSEIELPELLVSEFSRSPDVTISIGQTPIGLLNYTKKGVAYEATKNQFLLDLKDIARFYVTDGNSIIIESKREKNGSDIRLFLLGSCFGAILHQRKILTMHASAIIHEGAAVLFTGLSGAGKSSIANAFRVHGYKMLTDDVCPIRIIDGKPFASSSYPQSKLWEDALKELKLDFKQFKHIRKGINKRAVPILSDFERKPFQIKSIYLLHPHNGENISLINVQDANKFKVIKKMIYRRYLVRSLGVQSYHFANISQLASSIPVRRILRPKTSCLQKMISFIEEDLGKLNTILA